MVYGLRCIVTWNFDSHAESFAVQCDVMSMLAEETSMWRAWPAEVIGQTGRDSVACPGIV
jgi:hypothetical protein